MASKLFFRSKPPVVHNRSLPTRLPDSLSSGWNINLNQLRQDLTEGKERPKWILSAFSPGRNVPASLFEGMEYSPEELRVRFYELAAQGKENEADQEAIALWSKQEQSMKDAVNNVDNIPKFMEEADKKHPNRYDFCKTDGSKTREQLAAVAETQNSNTSTGFGTTNSAFGANNNTNNPFGKPPTSTFGQSQASSAFGTPAFGQSSFENSGSQQPNTFGRPSLGTATFGSPGFGQPAFGQASQPTSAFGQPSQPTSAFGQTTQPTSGFGQPAFGSTRFGSTASKNPFAAPSASAGLGSTSTPFGPSGQTSAAFGQTSQPTSAFGQPSQPTSAFGQPSQSTSAFGQPSQPSSTFGQTSQPASTFGQPSQSATSPFGQLSGSGSGSSGFGQTSQPTSAFGQPATSGGFGNTTSAFGQPSQPSTFGQGAFGKPAATPAFGQTGFGSNAAPPSTAFGQPAQLGPSSAFGQTTTASGFGSSPFGSAAPISGGFGQNGISVSSPFAAAPAATATAPNDQAMDSGDPVSPKAQAANPFDNPQQSATDGGFGMNLSLPGISEITRSGAISSPAVPPPNTTTTTTAPTPTLAVQPPSSSQSPHPLTSQPPKAMHYTQTLPLRPPQFNASKQLISYRGCRVEYFQDPTSANPNASLPSYQRPDGKGFERVWFPFGSEGPDIQALNKTTKVDDLQLEEDYYTDEVKEVWKRVFDTGRFEPGKVPVIPPLREWCLYDL